MNYGGIIQETARNIYQEPSDHLLWRIMYHDNGENPQEIIHWCYTTFNMLDWFYAGSVYYFRNHEDAVFFTLRWGE